MNRYFILQFVTGPTRGKNILDLVFSNNHDYVHSYYVTTTAVSDHSLVEVSTTTMITMMIRMKHVPGITENQCIPWSSLISLADK